MTDEPKAETETVHKFELTEGELASLFAMFTLGVTGAEEEVMAPSVFIIANTIARQVGLFPDDEDGKRKLKTTDAGQQMTMLMMAVMGKIRENGGEEAVADINGYMRDVSGRSLEKVETS